MTDKIVLDIETTGTDPKKNEMIQLSLVDADTGQPLFNSLIKPLNAKRWPKAESINGISPAMVKDSPTIEDAQEQVQKLLDQATTIVGYNNNGFDNHFLEAAGFTLPDESYDVMLKFSELVQEPNPSRRGYNKTPYKWFKLAQCAEHFNYDWGDEQAHDSLADAQATAFCYRKVEKAIADKANQQASVANALSDHGYYSDPTLSFSSVRQFAQNPARALACYKGKAEWFDKKDALGLGLIFHDYLETAVKLMQGQADVVMKADDKAQALAEAKQAVYDQAIAQVDGYIQQRLAEGDPEDHDVAAYQATVTKSGKPTADRNRVYDWFKALWFSKPMERIILQSLLPTQFDVQVERAFTSKANGVPYKGKLDLFVVDRKHKTIEAYDYKTSRPFAASGVEWCEDIEGQRKLMPVEWGAAKLFPWQAGAYRNLLATSDEFKDYRLASYRYLVVSKQPVPRLDVFNLTDESMTDGFAEFSKYLSKAHDYVTGKVFAPLVQDGSSFANQATYQAPIMHEVLPAPSEDPAGEGLGNLPGGLNIA